MHRAGSGDTGVRVHLHVDELDKVWSFIVESVPRPPSNLTVIFTFTPIKANTLRQTAIDHFEEPAYAAMGIPDVMLPEVKSVLKMEVESSPPDGVEPGVFRSIRVEKMWKRLVEKGIAEYLPDRRVYRVL